MAAESLDHHKNEIRIRIRVHSWPWIAAMSGSLPDTGGRRFVQRAGGSRRASNTLRRNGTRSRHHRRRQKVR